MKGFYCNGKHALCELDECPDDCEYFDDSGGELIDPIDYIEEPIVLTNFDRIKAMGLEELARFLDDINSQGCVCPARDCRSTCQQCIVEWLKQPAEVE